MNFARGIEIAAIAEALDIPFQQVDKIEQEVQRGWDAVVTHCATETQAEWATGDSKGSNGCGQHAASE